MIFSSFYNNHSENIEIKTGYYNTYDAIRYISISMFPRENLSNYPWKILMINYFSVIEFHWRVHENFQSNLYDAFNRPLVGLSSVSGANASRLSKRLLGLHKWAEGQYWTVSLTRYYISVPQYGQCLHAYLQPDMHDVTGGSLVRLSPVSGPNAPGVSQAKLGCY